MSFVILEVTCLCNDNDSVNIEIYKGDCCHSNNLKAI